MKYLVDTNILLRLVESTHPQHEEAAHAITTLRQEDNTFYILLQNISEFWNVCTRPVVKLSVSGVKVHDAKIVASMKAHNVRHLLTFNVKDFKRFKDIRAVDPRSIIVS